MTTAAIRMEEAKMNLSPLGGINLPAKVIDLAGMQSLVEGVLPKLKEIKNSQPYDKFRALALGFVAEAECLEDMDALAEDSAFCAVAGHVNAANTYGEFLRSFSPAQCRFLNSALIDFSLRLRSAAHPEAGKTFTLDLDSTCHQQYGKKIEGAEWNYKSVFGLDSLQAYDEFGFQYWMDVRPGATFTANGAEEVIHTVLSQLPRDTKRFLRADSGYCNTNVFNAAAAARAKFVITMRQNMLSGHQQRITNWRPTKKVIFKGDKDRACEIGHTVYRTKESKEALRLVVIRSPKKDSQEQDFLFSDERYDYAAWVTNIGEHEKSDEKIILFYRGRGNAENFIREGKNGFDLHHFPCSKLLANKAYGLIAAFAYSVMRFLAFVDKPKKVHFSKILRRKMIFKAVQVVKHAREITFRFSKHQLQEVKYWLKVIHIKFEMDLPRSKDRPRFFKTE